MKVKIIIFVNQIAGCFSPRVLTKSGMRVRAWRFMCITAASLLLISAICKEGSSGTINTPVGEIQTCPLEVIDWQPAGVIEDNFPTISATFKSDCSTDIDLSSLEMLFQDSPVSFAISGSSSEVTITYIPDSELTMDVRYRVIVRAKDVNGYMAEKTWRYYLPFHY